MCDWIGNNQVFRTYVKGSEDDDGKKPEKGLKLKGRKNVLSYEEASQNSCFGGLLQEGVIDISFDSDELSQKFWDMSEQNGWNCLILENPANGHIHSYWKKPASWTSKDGKDKKLAVGLIADIHSGDTYIPLRVKGEDRFPPSFEPDQIDEVPEELLPVDTKIDLLNLSEGDGRNESLFRYILILQSQLGIEKETARRILNNINTFVFSKELSENEMEVITRDEAFSKEMFYQGKTFCHDRFGDYLQREFHIIRINGRLHCYVDGVYISGHRYIENRMTEVIRSIKANQRTEVLKYLEVRIPEDENVLMQENLIAFKNGVLNFKTGELLPFSPEYLVTNKIPWDYNPEAYDELLDITLDKISCGDKEIRMLLEECAGYCLYRKNKLQKSFILTGEGSNGKSTYLEALKTMLGRQNYSALDLGELDDRFSTVMMTGKLANIGDDINNEFLNGKTLAVFKKIVTANEIKAENKGEDAFTFKPYTKLLFSANSIPRMVSKGFGAIKRRILIIPFNAHFSKEDPDFNPDIDDQLKNSASMEYLINLALAGLKRALNNKGFTESQKVIEEVEEFEKDNNPVLGWLDSLGEESDDDLISYFGRTPLTELYISYDSYCCQNGFKSLSNRELSKQLQKKFGLQAVRSTTYICGKKPTFLKPITL